MLILGKLLNGFPCSLYSLLLDLCITRDQKTQEVLMDLDYYKGYGISAVICPKGAIQLVLERW